MKTAVVTGASRGIGRAICLKLAQNNINVVVNFAGSEQKANEVVAECEKLGVKAMAIKADVKNPTEVEQMIKTAHEAFGSIDILVNNAGITRDNLIIRLSQDDLDQVIDTNLKGAYYCMKNVSRIMMKQRSGRIINISSVVGVSGNAGQVNYSASKAAILGMTKSLAKELAGRNVTVNAIAPGFIETDMTSVLSENITAEVVKNIPLSRFGKPEDIANAVCFLASDEAGYITGQTLCVDGGMVM